MRQRPAAAKKLTCLSGRALAGAVVAGILLSVAGCGGEEPAAVEAPSTVSLADQAPATPPVEVEVMWEKTFAVDTAALRSTGDNPYFPLRPGRRLLYSGNEDGSLVQLTITVTDRTEQVDGVLTRVVEERATKNGKLVEVAQNYLASDNVTGDLYCFGEDVDNYENGRVTNHNGSWRSGSAGAQFGLLLPGQPNPGDHYYQENAPGVALDRAEVITLTDSMTTPAGSYSGCLRTEETSGLNPQERGSKVYAPGVGLVADGALRLQAINK